MFRIPSKSRCRRSCAACFLALFIGFSGLVATAPVNATQCGALGGPGQYGPYDYRYDKDKLGIVEKFHFNAGVESLVRGEQGVNVGGDLDYVLRAFPNHHRALLSMSRLGKKLKSAQPPGVTYPIECYFERAIRFRPDDTIVKMLYASYLADHGRVDEGERQLDLATTMADDDPFTHYNLGLVYFDLKSYDKALRQAHKALELGFPRTELRNQLEQVGKWVDAAPNRSENESSDAAKGTEPSDKASLIPKTSDATSD